MSHYDDVTLALIAVGERGVTPDSEAHLAVCERCREEVRQLGAVVDAGRTVRGADTPLAPPASVWDRIVSELESSDADEQTATADAQEGGGVVALERRRGRGLRAWPLVAAAAVGVVVGAGGMFAATRSTPAPVASPSASPAAVTVASLQPLDDPTAAGQAVLRVASPTQRTVTVEVSGLPLVPGTFYEVWLMDPSNAHLVALGVLNAQGRGTYVVPAGLDLGRYSALDVSVQPMNGSPLHSSESAVRGSIAT